MTEIDTSNCLRVEDEMPYCVLAQKVALGRLAALDDVLGEARQAAEEMQGEEVNMGLIRARLRSIITAAEADPAPEAVPYDELLVGVVRELETVVSAEASALLEQAVVVVRGLSGCGWVVVRQGTVA